MLAQPLARVLGDVQRQRSVRAEQAEEPHLQPRRPAVASGLERRPAAPARTRAPAPVRSGPASSAGRRRVPPARLDVEQTLEPPQRLIEVVARAAPPPAPANSATASVSRPTVAPIDDLTPAQRSQDGLGERVDRHVARRRTARAPSPSRNALPPSKAISSTSTVISRPRPNARRGARERWRADSCGDDGTRRTTGRTRTDRTPSICFLRADVAARRVELQQIAQRRRAFLLASRSPATGS